jgi:hypothetical protein
MPKEPTEQAAECLADDLLKGATAIGNYLGLKEDEIYYLHKKKKLPIGKCGKHLISFRSKLERAMRALVP